MINTSLKQKSKCNYAEGKLKAAFVVSRAIKGTKIKAEVANALADYGLPVLESRITQRVIYPVSASMGTTVLDLDSEQEHTQSSRDAASEIRALVEEIKQKLK